eukprot:TRINITY_DN14467_c0_g1_i1.p2 TRINITY_DN14467_c0_g1~~TRINITY_DN14467_c0_g1_i1.p2  ORF type:complete len:100 (+),score=5.58 TRINITY_DN14467_c0_g1_i1:209-508(+)
MPYCPACNLRWASGLLMGPKLRVAPPVSRGKKRGTRDAKKERDLEVSEGSQPDEDAAGDDTGDDAGSDADSLDTNSGDDEIPEHSKARYMEAFKVRTRF